MHSSIRSVKRAQEPSINSAAFGAPENQVMPHLDCCVCHYTSPLGSGQTIFHGPNISCAFLPHYVCSRSSSCLEWLSSALHSLTQCRQQVIGQMALASQCLPLLTSFILESNRFLFCAPPPVFLWRHWCCQQLSPLISVLLLLSLGVCGMVVEVTDFLRPGLPGCLSLVCHFLGVIAVCFSLLVWIPLTRVAGTVIGVFVCKARRTAPG